MRDGLYLSTYLSPPGVSWLLGLWPRHDNNVSLWRKRGRSIVLERHWELERLSGLKQHGAPFRDRNHALQFIGRLLETEGVSLGDICEIWGTPFIETTTSYGILNTGLPFHSIAHLFTALMLDPEQFYSGKTLGLAVDGVPDFLLERTDYYYAGVYVDRGACTYFPIESPGRIYDSARERFNLRAGSLMALATATEARVAADAEALMEGLEFWGTQRVQQNGHSAVSAADELVSRATRLVEHCFSHDECIERDDRFTQSENVISATMKILQEACLRVMEKNIDRAIQRFAIKPDETFLALAGGFALNCPSNSHLFAKYGFQELLAPPCINDTGQSIGLALATFVQRCPDERIQFQFPGAFAGPSIDETKLRQELAKHGAHIVSVSDWNPSTFVADVQKAPVVWFDGPSEMGPRALGHRSLLADPTNLAMKTELNRIKKRQWWRPVAPLVMEQHLNEWFDSPASSPYMLRTFSIKPDHLKDVPAIAHLDASARIQSLREDDDPRLFAALSEFHRTTGVPMLCNTSLNDKGEPIVDTVAEAICFAVRKNISVGYFLGQRVEFATERSADSCNGPHPRTNTPFKMPTLDEFTLTCKVVNPHDLSPLHLYVYLTNPELRAGIDLEDFDAVHRFKNEVDAAFIAYPNERLRIEKYLSKVWMMHRPPCKDFDRHPWSKIMRFQIDEVRNVRPF